MALGFLGAWVWRIRRKPNRTVKSGINTGTFVNADETSGWNDLESKYEMKRINHHEASSVDGACTNHAEICFSRLRRARPPRDGTCAAVKALVGFTGYYQRPKAA